MLPSKHRISFPYHSFHTSYHRLTSVHKVVTLLMNYSFPFAPSASTKLCGLINCTNSARKSYTSLAIAFCIAYKMSFARAGTFYLSISSLRPKGSCSASVNAKNRECEDSSSTEHVQRTDFMNPGGFSAGAVLLLANALIRH